MIIAFSLDPNEDPLCSVFSLDYFALRSAQYEFLVEYAEKAGVSFCWLLFNRGNLERTTCVWPSVEEANFFLTQARIQDKGISFIPCSPDAIVALAFKISTLLHCIMISVQVSF